MKSHPVAVNLVQGTLVSHQCRGLHFPDLSIFVDFLDASIVHGPRMHTRFPGRILNVLIQHSVVDIVRCTLWPRVDLEFHQSG